jgi:hypothetical protein
MAAPGTPFASDLRVYKSGLAAGAPEAVARLQKTLADYLRSDEAAGLWRKAGMASGPEAVAVVPSGQGRPGAHPLTRIVASCVDLPAIGLSVNQKVIHTRDVDVDWLRVDPAASSQATGKDILVVEDTWVSGASAQSAAAALKLAGARHVAIVVLGRHRRPPA